MSFSQKTGAHRSWTGRKMQVFACVLVVCAVSFALYGPDHPKGITFSGPLTMLVVAAVFWQMGFKIQLRADCRYYDSRNLDSPRTTAAAPADSFDDDPIVPQSSDRLSVPEPSEDIMNAYWARQRSSHGI